MNSQAAIDERLLEMDRIIGERLRKDPAILAKARSVLPKWLGSCNSSVRPALKQWRAIFEGPLSGVIATLEGEDEKSTRLRQSSPLCGILTPAKRTAIMMSHAHDAGDRTTFVHPTA